MILKKQVDDAVRGNDWDLGNQVLYDLCEKYPHHKTKAEIVAKIWLIGRSYAAAIERRKEIDGNKFEGDDFYIEKVAPDILNSNIDQWLDSLGDFKHLTKDNLREILRVHLDITNLFQEISGLEKRSLTSKYLHFHYPRLFFIYDSRVISALSHLNQITGRVGKSSFEYADNEYRKVCEKCLMLRNHVEKKYGVFLSPRNLDNLLLEIETKSK